MNKDDILVLRKVQRESIVFSDLLGEHTGVIHNLEINDAGIFAYAIFFGQSANFRGFAPEVPTAPKVSQLLQKSSEILRRPSSFILPQNLRSS